MNVTLPIARGSTPLGNTTRLLKANIIRGVNEQRGTLASGQNYLAKVPTPNPGYPGVLYLHGLFGNANEPSSLGLEPRIGTFVDGIVGGGYTVLSCDFGLNGLGTGSPAVSDNDLCGNDTALGLIDEAVVKLHTLGVAAGDIFLMPWSAGGLNAWKWASLHLSDVLAFAGLQCVCDGDENYNAGTAQVPILGGSGGRMDQAYGGAGAWLTVESTRDPDNLAAGGAFTGLHAKLWRGSADPWMTATAYSNMATAIGGTASVATVTGADHTTMVSTLNPRDVVAYLDGFL